MESAALRLPKGGKWLGVKWGLGFKFQVSGFRLKVSGFELEVGEDGRYRVRQNRDCASQTPSEEIGG